MTFPYEIAVWRKADVPDYYGGVVEGYELAANAPMWANITQASDGQVALFGGTPNNALYDVTVNYREDFTWMQGDLIDCRFGKLAVESIVEDVRMRKITIRANRLTYDTI
jgi:hypothetical protein